MGFLLAWLRIFGLIISLMFLLTGLLIANALLGSSWDRGLRYRRRYTSVSKWILGVRVLTKGTPVDGPALYVSNHRSLLDPFLNLNVIDAVIVSKAEVSKYPLVGRGTRATGVIFVHRQHASSRNEAKEALRSVLTGGKSVLIYPEGTTSNELTTQEFRLGSFKVAAEESIPVVPVAIDYRNPDHKWHSGGLLPFFVRKFSSRKIYAGMVIGEPLASDSAEKLCELARSWIDDQLLKMEYPA